MLRADKSLSDDDDDQPLSHVDPPIVFCRLSGDSCLPLPAFPPPPRKFTSRGLGECGGCHHAAGFIWGNLAERDRALNPWVATSELKAAVHAAYVESRFALHLDAMPCLAIPLGFKSCPPAQIQEQFADDDDRY